MLNFFDVVIAALAVWRLAHMFKYESGPWDMFVRIREKLGESMFGRAMDCGACMSVWLSLLIVVPGIKYFLIVMAISAIAMTIEGINVMLRKEASINITTEKSGSFLPGVGNHTYSPRSDDW